ncbi:hypothetical protein Agabi119p4_10382 [Agaricus bisporus var. burnettii]|uniref:DUF6533 domain-containing protein n=1 Tax=Agaricus bisporus var. burnettii TaxID=192524 RepID=A0A8H7EW84_AGABI|nr:hypothetical protein Agabi119p4_10382 [Agaricus bisporus var. burnettii]
MPEYPPAIDDAREALLTNYIGVASFTALVWDHIDTFADEVEYIWKGRKGAFIYLFLFNRYFTPLGFIVNLHAFISPIWSSEVCARFIKYEGFTVALAVEVVGVMMLLRIRAIYSGRTKTYITILLSTILIIETGINIWLISYSHQVIHNPQSGATSCSVVFDIEKPGVKILGPSSAWIPLVYDTIVFALTLYRTIPPLRNAPSTSDIIERLFGDGLMYYSVILAVTLVLTIMLIKSPQGIRQIAAQTEQLITVAMMSRITLNLRKAAHKRHTRFTDSSEDTPEHGFWFWFHRLFPGLRQGVLLMCHIHHDIQDMAIKRCSPGSQKAKIYITPILNLGRITGRKISRLERKVDLMVFQYRLRICALIQD